MKQILRRVLCAALMFALFAVVPAPFARAADESPKLVAFTFDDGPSGQTARLLDGLEARGAVATFFMCGKNGNNGLSSYSHLVSRMLEIGCEPGNHSNGHPNFTKISAAQMRQQIADVEAYLYQQAGAEYTEVVRIPYGSNTATIRQTVNRPMIRWSVDPQDWKYRDADVVYRNIVNKVTDGSIVLLHDLYATSVDGALRAIDTLKTRGYEFVTVSELFRRRGIELESGQVYFSAPDKGVTLPAYSLPEIAQSIDKKAGVMRVSLNVRESGLTIHYTTDGSVPTLTSPVYTAPLELTSDVYLRVAGFDRFAARTPVLSRGVTVTAAAPKVAAWKNGLLTLRSSTIGASIWYTTDGSDPAVSGTLYTGAFEPSGVTRAVARAEGVLTSEPLQLVRLNSGALFCDIPAGASYLSAVDDVVARGLMTGVGDWRFDPQNPTTRAAMVTTLYRLAGASVQKGAPTFADVPDGEWFTDAVRWAAAEGIVEGKEDDMFAPNDPLTWEQAATIMARYAAHARLTSKMPTAVSATSYPGASDYAVSSLAWCAANGIPYRNADGFAPTEPIPRADLARMLSGLCALMQ